VAEIHPALSISLDAFRREERQKPDPIIAIIGPPGSGKSALLRGLVSEITSRDNDARLWTPLTIDLLDIKVGSEEDMYRQVVTQLMDSIGGAGLSVGMTETTKRRQFDDLILSTAKSVSDRVLLTLDHLEWVPREFAESISQRLRAIKESSYQHPEANRVGLVIAGAMSLHELTTSTKSAFHTARTVQLPTSDRVSIQSYIRACLVREGHSLIEQSVVDYLAQQTGGEPMFVEVILRRVRNKSISQLTLDETRGICSNISPDELPHLRHASLHLTLNRDLAEIANKIIQGKHIVQRGRGADIDQFQLTGVVVLDRSQRPPTYMFRNGLVAGAVERLLSPKSFSGYDWEFAASLSDLAEAKRYIGNVGDIATSVAPLHSAWKTLTGLGQPLMHIALGGMPGNSWRVMEIPSTSANVPTCVNGAIGRLFDLKGTVFHVEAEAISYAIPLRRSNGVFGCFVTTVAISTEVVSEHTLQHWAVFISELGESLMQKALAEIGRTTLTESSMTVNTAIVGDRATSQLYLNLQLEPAVALTRTQVLRIEGHLSRSWNERVHRLDVKLLEANTSIREFESMVEQVGADVNVVLRDLEGLAELLTDDPESQNWIVASPIDGLKLPIELLHNDADRIPLLLKTGVARRIEGIPTPNNVAAPFSHLLRRLKESDSPLRVLLVGSDPTEELATDAELDEVKQAIRSGCAAMGITTSIEELPSEFASGTALRNKLDRCRPFHLFHFAGHGFHTPRGDQDKRACIRLNDCGRPQDIPSDVLQAWLLDCGLWLCFMSACRTATISGEGVITSGGLIDDLLHAGIPNYVGFRWPVTAQSSRIFARAFYQRLFEPPSGAELSSAILYARRAAKGSDNVNDAWASSILVSQCPV
jgi:hypothetical protein